MTSPRQEDAARTSNVAQVKRVLVAVALLGSLLAVPASGTSRAGEDPDPTLPRAAKAAEPDLPAPRTWPGTEDFPRTSGTGQLVRGSLLWSDWLYDDHGTTGVPGGNPVQTAGTPSFGTYSYADPDAHGNGADVFRAGVHLGSATTTWRVDWTTLADPTVPLAVWGFDTDGDATTGASSWPGGAGVSSPGVDRWLVLSSRAALVLDAAGGVLHRSTPVVDRAARSFVTAVPNSVLRPAGTWRVRLVAGLADAAGTGFARPQGALPGQPAVYNVSFRKREQEPPLYSFWNDGAQTRALLQGDVTPFSLDVRWSDLASRRTPAPAPPPAGWSVRWYASSVELGPGIVTDPASISDRGPNYLGRVQPYSVYVPRTYRPGKPAPLTWLLHSLTQNHNQYGATTPKFVQQACEDRGSVCVTTMGRGPDGYYDGVAELDLWEVWREVGEAVSVDRERVTLGGYSMGGLGTTKIAAQHPDLFAATVVLAGASGAVPGLANLREVPGYLAHGALDELIPVQRAQEQANRYDALGQRYRFLLHPAADHVGFQLQDGFSDAAAWMGDRRRAPAPGRVSFRWTRDTEQSAKQPYGVTGAYWLSALRGRAGAAESRAEARSGALPERSVTPVRTRDVLVPGDPSPARVTQLEWLRGTAPKAARRLVLDLTGVAEATVQLDRAGLGGRAPYELVVVSDGPATVRLHADLRDTVVRVGKGRTVRTVRPGS